MGDDKGRGGQQELRLHGGRSFLTTTTLAGASAAAIVGQSGCADGSAIEGTTTRGLVQPSRQSWKRRETHPLADNGQDCQWYDTVFEPTDGGAPSTVQLFDQTVIIGDFESLLVDNAVEMDVTYVFLYGVIKRQTERVAPLEALADAVGYRLPEVSDGRFLAVSSMTRGETLQSVVPSDEPFLEEPDFSYAISFDRGGLGTAVIVFDQSVDAARVAVASLDFYSLPVEGYGAPAYVKYFSGLWVVNEISGQSADDLLVENLSQARFFDADANEFVAAAPLDWG